MQHSPPHKRGMSRASRLQSASVRGVQPLHPPLRRRSRPLPHVRQHPFKKEMRSTFVLSKLGCELQLELAHWSTASSERRLPAASIMARTLSVQRPLVLSLSHTHTREVSSSHAPALCNGSVTDPAPSVSLLDWRNSSHLSPSQCFPSYSAIHLSFRIGSRAAVAHSRGETLRAK